jgi:hypothetical protein
MKKRKSALIEVTFMVTEEDVETFDPLSSWIQRDWDMPWLNYLLEHNEGIETKKFYDAPTHMYEVRFRLYLPPELETMYRLRFN